MRRGSSFLAAVLVCYASSIVNADIIGTYVDANLSNTTPTSAITEDDVDTDNLWRHRIYPGPMDGTLFASQADSEDCPTLTTTVTDVANGVYNVYGIYWDKDVNDDWGIEAAVGSNPLSIYTPFNGTQTGLTADDKVQYQALIGQVTVSDGTFSVTIDDGVGGGGCTRVWYDGVSYAAVPEPTSMVLLVLGLFGFLAYAWRKRK